MQIAVGLGVGAGSDAAAALYLQLVSSGLVVARSFDETSTTDLGAGWTKDVDGVTTWQVADDSGTQRLRAQSNSANFPILRYTGATVAEPFVQVYEKSPSLVGVEEQAVITRYTSADYGVYSGAGLDNFIGYDGDNAGRIARFVAGSHEVLATDASIVKDSTLQFATWDGNQQYWRSGDAAALATTNTFRDGVTGGYVAFRSVYTLGGTATFWWSVFLICELAATSGPYIVVTGLGTGQKAKVRNGSDTVIAQATESGGTATINVSRYQEAIDSTGSDEIVPLAGFAALTVETAGDSELYRYDSGSIYPGSTFKVDVI